MRPVSTASEEGRLKLLLPESGGGELWEGPEENSAAEGGSKLQRRGLEDALSMKPILAQAMAGGILSCSQGWQVPETPQSRRVFVQ